MADRLEELEKQRLAKVEALRGSGVDPYPVRFDRTHTSKEIHDKHGALPPETNTGEIASVAGRLMLKRTQGPITFAEIQDGTGRMAKEFGGKVGVVATGGLAPVIMPETVTIDHHEPWLTLLGLHIIYDRNTSGED